MECLRDLGRTMLGGSILVLGRRTGVGGWGAGGVWFLGAGLLFLFCFFRGGGVDICAGFVGSEFLLFSSWCGALLSPELYADIFRGICLLKTKGCHICTYIYIYIYMCTYTYIYIYVHIYLYIMYFFPEFLDFKLLRTITSWDSLWPIHPGSEYRGVTIYIYIYIYIYVPVPGPRTPPPPQWYGPPTPPHHPHLGDDAGNAGDAVQYRATNPKPKSTKTQTHPKPTANQP